MELQKWLVSYNYLMKLKIQIIYRIMFKIWEDWKEIHTTQQELSQGVRIFLPFKLFSHCQVFHEKKNKTFKSIFFKSLRKITNEVWRDDPGLPCSLFSAPSVRQEKPVLGPLPSIVLLVQRGIRHESGNTLEDLHLFFAFCPGPYVENKAIASFPVCHQIAEWLCLALFLQRHLSHEWSMMEPINLYDKSRKCLLTKL